ncbi:MAG: hypothetical protein OXQ92_14780 [Boseongicola sp.]|nr:hypothetical protein [Boseongicola sp.]MDD9977880.1 hypothetical protein [Boseongicola sp.]
MTEQHFTSPALDKTTKDKLDAMYAELQALRRAIADVARDCDDKVLMQVATRSLDRATAARIRRKNALDDS